MKLLSLDIDGVLTSINRGTSYKLGDPSKYRLDQTCLNRLKYLFNMVPDIKVIIHSNWRKHLNNNECMINGKIYHSLMPRLIEILGDRYLGYPSHSQGNNKSGDIKNYLAIKKFNDVKIAIIDDSSYDELDKLNYNSKYFQVDEVEGLDVSTVMDVINYFRC